MTLTDVQQQTLDRLLLEDGNPEVLPEFLTQIDEKLVDVDEYYHTKDYIYECDDGRYFCLTVTQHSSMGDYESAYFYEVFPKEVTTIQYFTKEDL
jgi:hypothetical protein